MPASVASTTTWPWAETEVASPAGGAVPPPDQLTPPLVDSVTVLFWVSPAALVALVHTSTSRAGSPASTRLADAAAPPEAVCRFATGPGTGCHWPPLAGDV